MLLRLMLEGEDEGGLGTPGPNPKATGGGHSTLGDTRSSPPFFCIRSFQIKIALDTVK